jgi:hypothetical protein
MPHRDPIARAAYQRAYAVFNPTDADKRRAYQRLRYSVCRDEMREKAATYRRRKRAEALAGVPPLVITKAVFLDTYSRHFPDARGRTAHALWAALTAAVAVTAPKPDEASA